MELKFWYDEIDGEWRYEIIKVCGSLGEIKTIQLTRDYETDLTDLRLEVKQNSATELYMIDQDL